MTRSRFLNVLSLALFVGAALINPIHQAQAAGASMYLSPSTGTKVIDSTFKVSVMVNSGGEPINAAEGSISYDASLLEATSVAKGNIFMFWTTEPSIGGGGIKFGGGNPSAYTGTAGHVLTVTFKAKKAGTAQVRFTSGAVLANDGKGTNILASMGSASFTISPKVDAPKVEAVKTTNTSTNTTTKPATNTEKATVVAPKVEAEYNKPVIKSSTHPDPNTWYQADDIIVSWELPKGVTGVSVSLDQKPVSDPGPEADGLFDSKEFKDNLGGVWYVHVKFKDASKWGTVENFKVMIDLNPPNPFKINVSNIEIGEWPILEFDTKDEESGLAKYEIYIGSLEHQAYDLEADKKSFQLSDLEAGAHTILIKAIDKAGNQRVETVEFVIDPIPTPIIVNYSTEIKPGDKFYMNGTALANSMILVFLEDDSRLIASSSVMADANGNWFYVHDVKLDNGRYAAYVQAVNEKGLKSGDSSKISFVVSPPVFAVIGAFIIDYFTVIVSLIFMIVLIILIVFFLVYFARKKLRKETIEVEEVVKRNLGEFRKELDTEFEAIMQKETRVSGKKDKTLAKERLDSKLNLAEKKIMKEVKDVEDILD